MNDLFPSRYLLFILLSGHLIGDFIFQTNKVYELKSKGVSGVILHSSLVSAANLIFVLYAYRDIRLAVSTTAIILLTHSIIDYLKIRSGRDDVLKFIVDQMAHMIVIIVLASAVSFLGILPAAAYKDERFASMIVSLLFATYFFKYLTYSFYPIFRWNPDEPAYYDIMDFFERLIIFTVSYLQGFGFLAIPFIIIPRIVYAINKGKEFIFYDIMVSILTSVSCGIIFRKFILSNSYSGSEIAIFTALFAAAVLAARHVIDFTVRLIYK